MIVSKVIPLIAPELFIAAFVLILTVMSTRIKCAEKFRDFRFTSLVGAGGLAAIVLISERTPNFRHALIAQNDLTHFGKVLISFSFILTLMFLFRVQRQQNQFSGLCAVLFLSSTLGAYILLLANHALVFFLGLELMSLSFYLLTLGPKYNARPEAYALKYMLFGGVSSMFLLLGFVLIYMVTGSLSFDGIAAYNASSVLFLWGAAFILISMLCKLALVPFHWWIADVYEKASTPVVAHMSILSMITFGIFMLRLMQDLFPQVLMLEVQIVLLILASLTMLFSAFSALTQTVLKRLMAYVTLFHAGLIFAALTLQSDLGNAAALFSLIVYTLGTLGVYGAFVLLRYRGTYLETIQDLTALSKIAPALSAALLLCLLSLSGMPLFAGFFAKVAIFQSLIASGYVVVVPVVTLSSLLMLYCAVHIARVMYCNDRLIPLRLDDNSANPILYTLVLGVALLTLLFGLFPDELISLSQAAL